MMETPMPLYLIGTLENQGGAACVGSRAARSYRFDEALEETRIYSHARHVKESWLREYRSTDPDLGPVFARFRKGRRLS
jgi:hypothetical protein